MKKVLITGGSGLLGQHLNLTLSKNCKILTTYNNNLNNCGEFNSEKIDLLNEKELKILFQEFKPEIVIHAAAITNPVPSKNQSAKDYFDLNVTATKNISSLCESFHSKLIYISTDLVYAGYRGSFLKEDAKLIPASLYAETKLVGESKVKEFTDNYLILRTALLYGFGLNHSQCHFHIIYNELRNNKPVKLLTEQSKNALCITVLSGVKLDLAEMELKGKIINLGGIERVSRFELGEMLCSIAGFDKDLRPMSFLFMTT